MTPLILVGNIPPTVAATQTTITVGSNPFGVAITPDGSTAYVTNAGGGTVSVINVASGAVTSTITVGTNPRGVAFSPDGSTAYAINAGTGGTHGTVSVINAASGTVTSTITVGVYPNSVAFTPDGSKAYVANDGDGTVSVVNVASGVVATTITVGNSPIGIAVSPDGSMAYVTDNAGNNVPPEVLVISVASDAVTATIPIGTNPYGVAFTPDGSTAYVTNWATSRVSVINVASGTVTSTITVGTNPHDVAFTPDGSTAYVTNFSGGSSLNGTVSVINVASGTVTSTIPVGGNPEGIALTPDGSAAYVANFGGTGGGSNTVWVINVSPALAPPALTADTPPITATVGSAYAYTFSATGNPAPRFAVSSGALPAGLSLDTTGVLSGTPTVGGQATFTVTASNAISPDAVTPPITITVNPAPASPSFTANTPPATATVGAAYAYTFSATGYPATSFAVSSGALPAGLSLDTSSGVLSGAPTAGEQATFTVTASNAISPDAVTPPITITVNPAPASPVFTADTPPAKATVRDALTYAFTATGYPAPSFYVSSGALPAGLTLDGATGILSGTPTAGGRATFTVTATNGVTPDAVTPPIHITVTHAPVR